MFRFKFKNRYSNEAHGIRGFINWQIQKFPNRFRKKRLESEPYPNFKPTSFSNIINTATYVNHSTFIFNVDGKIIITDPIWSEYCSPISGIGPKRLHAPGILFDSLPRVDAILISHNHYDHLDFETCIKLNDRFKPLFLVPKGVSKTLKDWGIENVIELDWFDSHISFDLEFIFLPAEHFSGRGAFDQNKSLWGSWAIKDQGRAYFFAGDTGHSPHFNEIKYFLNCPVLFSTLPIGAYLPRWFMRPVHMSPEDAILAHQDLGSQKSVAMHFGTFELADDRREDCLVDFKLATKKHDISEEEFSLPLPGQSFSLLGNDHSLTNDLH